jgi:predicted nucleic acid-binding Zn ribbon protein
MPRHEGPQPLGSVMKQLIDQLGIRKKIDAARVIETWAALAGPQINGVTDSVRLRGRTLHVKIRSSAWRHELHLQRGQWCRRLNEQLGEDLVEAIAFR